jgi:uncharacterized protein (TIGR03083 family)
VIEAAQLGPPIDVRGLFPRERAALLALLGDLAAGDWDRATVCPGWTVKDVTAHILHDDLRRLASMRDGHQGPRPAPGEPVATFLHRVNQEWVATVRFLSTRQLAELLTRTGEQLAAVWPAMDPDADSVSVSWAGLDPAPVWLDAARELSECWTHQQQLRDATGRPGLADRELLTAVLDTFLRALPFTLRDTAAEAGAQLQVEVTGAAPMRWTATRRDGGWFLDRGRAEGPAATLEVDDDTLWRVCTRNITPEDARDRVRVRGDRRLAEQALRMVSIIR